MFYIFIYCSITHGKALDHLNALVSKETGRCDTRTIVAAVELLRSTLSAILPRAEGRCTRGVYASSPPPVRRHADTVCRSRKRSVLSGALRNTADGQFHLINRDSCVRHRWSQSAIEAAVAHELYAAE